MESPNSEPTLFGNRWAKEFAVTTVTRPKCQCLDPQYGDGKWQELKLHVEQQDTTSEAWARLLQLVDDAAKDRREEFSPSREMTPAQWAQIVTLPPSIANLKDVKHFILYGSSLVSIPPTIGEMSNLEEFTPYTSYRLHWFPYEIIRCRNLKRSTVSTRALYGNYRYRPPFPKLPQPSATHSPSNCSICDESFCDSLPLQRWVSLGIATDVLPLLVHACSEKCLSQIPAAPKGYVQGPHQGGLGLKQPPKR